MKRLSCSHVTVAVCLCDSTPLRINCASGMCAAACVGPVTVRVRAMPGCVCVMMHRGLPVAAAAARLRVALGVGPGAGRAMARRKPEGHTAAAPPAAVTPSHGRTVTRSRCKSRPVTLSSLRAPPRLALRQLQAASPGEPEGARLSPSLSKDTGTGTVKKVPRSLRLRGPRLGASSQESSAPTSIAHDARHSTSSHRPTRTSSAPAAVAVRGIGRAHRASTAARLRSCGHTRKAGCGGRTRSPRRSHTPPRGGGVSVSAQRSPPQLANRLFSKAPRGRGRSDSPKAALAPSEAVEPGMALRRRWLDAARLRIPPAARMLERARTLPQGASPT